MYGKLVSLFGAAAAAVFLAGCSVTATMYPPFDKESMASSKPFLGNWKCVTDSDRYDVALSPHKENPEAVRIRIVQTPAKPEKNYHGNWAPLDGMFMEVEGKYFLAVSVAVDRLLNEAQCNGSAVWMLGRFWYLALLTENARGLELRFVSFAVPPKKGKAWTPVDPSVKLQDNLVLNPTAELRKLLIAGKYHPDDKVYLLVREKAAAKQNP